MADPTLNLNQAQTSSPSLNLWEGGSSSGSTTSYEPSYSGLKGVFLNSDSPLSLSNIAGTVGMGAADLIGGALAPETGGLSLIPAAALSSALGGASSAAGKAAQNVLTGQNATKNLGSAAGSGAIGGVLGSVGGKVLGSVVGKAGDLVSGGLSSEADNLALKGLGLTPAQAKNFAIKNGIVDSTGVSTPSAVVKWVGDNGLSGQGLEAVTSKVNDLQGQFDSIVKASSVPVQKQSLVKNMEESLSPFKNSTDPADQSIAQRTQTIYDNITAKYGENPTLSQINSERQLYDSKTSDSQFRADPQQFGPARIVGDALRQTVRDTADSIGAFTEAGSLKQTGQQLSKLYDLQRMAEANSFKGITGSTPGLLNYISSLTGGSMAGPGGAFFGAVLPNVLKSPEVMSTLSKGANAVSEAVGSNAPKVSEAIASPTGQATIGGTAMALGQSANPEQSSQVGNPVTNTVPTLSLSGDQAQTGVQAMQSGKPLTQSQYQALLQKDLVETGGRFSDKITAAYQAGNPSAVQGLGVASNAANTLQDLYNTAGGAKGGVMGNIETALSNTNLTAPQVKAYNSQKAALGQEIISQIYGSSGTSSDRDQVLSLIPDVTDLPAVAASKMTTLRSLIQQRLSSMTGSTPSSVSALNSPSLSGARP